MSAPDVLEGRHTSLLALAEDAGRQAAEAAADIETLKSQLVGDASADANAEYQAALDRLSAAKETRVEVDAALERLSAGTYGVCLVCGNAIPAERLDLRPQTPTCVGCS